MGAQLGSVEAKFKRAEKHLNDIRAEISRNLHGDAEAMFGYIDFDAYGNPHPSRYGTPISFDPDLPCQVGDFINNIRAALDHLAWGLVLVSGGKPGSTTYFPLMSKRNTPGKRTGRVL